MADEIYSFEIERHAIGGLLKHPHVFAQIDHFVTEYDFYSDTHQTIYCVIEAAYASKEKLDRVLLAQKIKNLGISFKDDIDIFDYIKALYLTQISEEATFKAFQELVKLRVLREVVSSADAVKQYVRQNKDKGIDEIITRTDSIFNEKVANYSRQKRFKNIFEDIESVVEKKGNDYVNKVEPEYKPLMGPFSLINEIYGSLLKPAAINLVGARTGVGKTSLGMFYLVWVAQQYNLPILHLDFGEMTPEELQIRATCMFTKGVVPYDAIDTGEWRANEKWVELVRSVWPMVKGLNVHYQDISDMMPEEIISLIRRYSYGVVGRGNRFLIHYDYLKPFNFDPKTPEYKEMGHFMQKVKSLLVRELPWASMWASLQLNRTGIVNNKTSAEVDDSENSFSMSDRIIQQCTHAWLVRPKLMDELVFEGNRFGNAVMKNMKSRHLGRNFRRHFNPVKVEKGNFKRNYLNIYADSFYFEEKGDLNDMVRILQYKGDVVKPNDKDGPADL